ncbi:MAG: RidA family protein [Dehalococcoidia bacterium]|nr:RidA family protein [Dehalococcoidia bacterium]
MNPGWPHYARYTFAPAVKRGNMLFISGMTATDENGVIVGPGDIVAQTRYIFVKMGKILEAAGATYDDIVMTTDYITTTEGYAGTADVRREFFTKGFPASTGVIVAGLLRRGALIEIDAIAMVGP